MKFLVVDNTTHLLPHLIALLPGQVEVRRFDQLSGLDARQYDAIIFSGGSDIPVLGNEQLFADEMKWSKAVPVPIIGICLGAEIIARAYGAELIRMDDRERGEVDILVRELSPCFGGKTSFRAYENHRWVITNLPSIFVPLATSAHGVEVFRHSMLPLYGFQYHPEYASSSSSEGRTIFLSLLSSLISGVL